MTVNLTENIFLKQVQKIKLVTETELELIMLLIGNLSSKMYTYPISYQEIIFHIYLSFNWFLLLSVLFWGTLSWLREEGLFSKKCFSCRDRFCGENLWGNCSTETNDQTEKKGVSQNVFSSTLNTANLKIFANHG